jgi:hypothetical protein
MKRLTMQERFLSVKERWAWHLHPNVAALGELKKALFAGAEEGLGGGADKKGHGVNEEEINRDISTQARTGGHLCRPFGSAI